MSENNWAKILEGLTPETVENELAFSFVGDNQQIQIRFSDGARILPDYVVHGLGGAEKIKEAAAALSGVTYEQFLSGFNKTMERRALNDFQRQFVGGHFGRLKSNF